MEYERIEKPSFSTQGAGFSPKRLRAMLLGVERRRKDAGARDDEVGDRVQEEEYGAVPVASVRSDARRGSICEEYNKDVDMVSTMSGSSSSVDTVSGHRSAHSTGSRLWVPEEDSCDSKSVASNFELHKEQGGSARSAPTGMVAPFSKPPPSEWDDAQNWILRTCKMIVTH